MAAVLGKQEPHHGDRRCDARGLRLERGKHRLAREGIAEMSG